VIASGGDDVEVRVSGGEVSHGGLSFGERFD
jgi:hypothetical protein